MTESRQAMTSSTSSANPIKKYLPVYFTMLAISGIEALLSFVNLAMPVLVEILLALAFGSATLGVMYFMHLADERRSLFLTLIPAVILVLLLLNAIWPDSLRLLHMRPVAH